MANKQRLQVDSGLGPVVVRPGAQHINTFAPTEAGRKLSALASSLSQLSPGLMRFSGQIAEEEKQTSIRQAEADARAWDEARKDNDGMKQAIKEGLIRPDQSPWYRWAAKQYFGRKAAMDYEAVLAERVESELGDSYDADDFNELESKVRKEFLAQTVGDQRDATFSEAFGRESDARVAGMRTNFARQAGARLRKMTLEKMGAVIAEHIEGFVSDVPDADDDAGYAQLASKIQTEMDRLVAVGESPIAVNRAVTQALVRLAAQEDNEVDVKKLANLIVTDKKAGSKLGYTLEVERAIDQAEDEAASDSMRKARDRRQRAEWQQEDTYNKVTTDYISSLTQADNPADVRPEEVVAQLRAQGITNPQLLQAPYQFYQNAIEGRATTNTQLLNSLWAGVTTGETSLADIRSAVSQTEGGISAHDGAFLWNAIQEQEDRRRRLNGGGNISAALNNDAFRLYLTEFKRKWGNDVDLSETEANRREFAVGELASRWLQFAAQSPGSNLGQQLEWLKNQGEGLFRTYADPSTVTDVLQDVGAGNTFRQPQLPREKVQTYLHARTWTGSYSDDAISDAIRLGVPPEAIEAFYRDQGLAYGIRAGRPQANAAPATAKKTKEEKQGGPNLRDTLLGPSSLGNSVGERLHNIRFQ